METALNEVRTGALNRLWRAMMYRWLGCPIRARYEMQMCIDRLTDSGDYTPNGHYDTLLPGWRDPDCPLHRIAWNRATASANDHTSRLADAAMIGAGIPQTPPAAM